MKEPLKDKSILLFDGLCNLCDSSVQFILKHERNHELLFCSLQSPAGLELLKHYAINPLETDSLVLIEKNKAYIKSSAALRVTKYLKGFYKFASVFLIVPAFIRNAIYDWVARNRFKWYGKKDQCLIPAPQWQSRFL